MTDIAPILGLDPAPPSLGASSVAGRIARGLAANAGGVGVNLIIQLVSVPVLLASWGAPAYGEWLILSAVPTYVALTDLSFSSVAGNSMVMLEAAGRHADAVVLGRRLWSIVTAMTGLAVMAAVAVALIFGGAFGSGAAIPASEARVVLIALFLQVAVGNQYGVLDAWYRAGGRYPLGTTMRQLGRLMEFGALIGAVLLGARPGVAAASFLAGSVAGFAVSRVVLRRAVQWSTFRPARPHMQTFRDLLAPGIAYMAFPVGNALSLQGFTIVVGSTLGVAAVVIFSTTRTITRIALQAMGSINSAIWPELSRSVGSGRVIEARMILRRATQASLAMSLSLVLLVALLGQQIIRSWTHGIVDPPQELLNVLLLVVVANSVSSTISTVLFATNRHRQLAVVYVLGVVVALLAAFPLSHALGLPGTAASLLVIEAGLIGYVLPAALRVVEDRPVPFLLALIDIRETIRSVKVLLRPDSHPDLDRQRELRK